MDQPRLFGRAPSQRFTPGNMSRLKPVFDPCDKPLLTELLARQAKRTTIFSLLDEENLPAHVFVDLNFVVKKKLEVYPEGSVKDCRDTISRSLLKMGFNPHAVTFLSNGPLCLWERAIRNKKESLGLPPLVVDDPQSPLEEEIRSFCTLSSGLSVYKEIAFQIRSDPRRSEGPRCSSLIVGEVNHLIVYFLPMVFFDLVDDILIASPEDISNTVSLREVIQKIPAMMTKNGTCRNTDQETLFVDFVMCLALTGQWSDDFPAIRQLLDHPGHLFAAYRSLEQKGACLWNKETKSWNWRNLELLLHKSGTSLSQSNKKGVSSLIRPPQRLYSVIVVDFFLTFEMLMRERASGEITEFIPRALRNMNYCHIELSNFLFSIKGNDFLSCVRKEWNAVFGPNVSD